MLEFIKLPIANIIVSNLKEKGYRNISKLKKHFIIEKRPKNDIKSRLLSFNFIFNNVF